MGRGDRVSVRRAQDERLEGNPDGVGTAITGIMDVPDAPTIGAITDPGTDGYASVAFTVPATGGTATSYTATSSPGSITGSAASSPITVTGLNIGTSYTFTVAGSNSTGTGNSSAASASFTPAAHTSFESIATATPSGTFYVTLSSIPQTYKSLQIRLIGLTAAADTINMYPNSDTGTNYSGHELRGNGTAASAYGFSTGTSYIYLGTQNYNIVATDATYPMSVIIDIIDYASTSKYKTIRVFTGQDRNGATGATGGIALASYLWLNTTAISSLKFSTLSTNNFTSGSSIALYGIK